jgi:glycosyltransferase involved in cell wall biosynthesis
VHDWLTGMRGGEKVLEVLLELVPAAPVYTLFHLPGSVSPAIESHTIVTSFLQHAPGLARWYRYYLPLFPRAIESLRLPPVELVVSSSHCVAKGAIPPPGARHVCYCHTPVRYAWDQEAVYFPRRGGPLGTLRAAALARLRRWDAATAGRVTTYVANSRFVAERIRTYYGREAVVVPPPVDLDFFTPDGGEREGFCLFASGLAPYKRIDLAMAACERAGVPLLVAGEGPERRRLERRAGPGTRFLGRVSAEALRDLYRRALCFLQSGVEDFGIASVEALACGCPVVACGRGGVLDIVEAGRHGLLVDPESGSVGLADAIDKVRSVRFNPLDLRQRAEGFSKVRCRSALGALLLN